MINFNFPKNFKKEEKLNMMMEYIVNRAAKIPKNINKIFIEFDDTYKGLLAYKVIDIISIYFDKKQVQFYTNKNLKKCRYYNKNNNIKIIPNFLKKFIFKKNYANWNIYNKDIALFSGFEEEVLKEIAIELFLWKDNIDDYLQNIKQLKEIKENNND